MSETPEQPRLYGPDLAPELAALLLRGGNEACNARIEQLLTWWNAANNGVIRNLIFDLAYQYASTLLQLHDGNPDEAAEWAEYTALDRAIEHDATINQTEDLEWPFDEDGNPKRQDES